METRFLNHVEPMMDDRGCWEWTAYRLPHGYGLFTVKKGDRRLAHRIAYSLFVGHIPGNLNVCHSCDNCSCVNPAHLFLGTQRDNMLDKIAKGRDHNQKKTTCPQGHPYDGYNPYLKNARICSSCQKEQKRTATRRYRARNLEELREKDRVAQRLRRARLKSQAAT